MWRLSFDLSDAVTTFRVFADAFTSDGSRAKKLSEAIDTGDG